MVSEAGLEPARPFSQSLAPQASASANSATPTCLLRSVWKTTRCSARYILPKLGRDASPFLNFFLRHVKGGRFPFDISLLTRGWSEFRRQPPRLPPASVGTRSPPRIRAQPHARGLLWYKRLGGGYPLPPSARGLSPGGFLYNHSNQAQAARSS